MLYNNIKRKGGTLLKKVFCIALCIICMVVFTSCTQKEIQDTSSGIISSQAEVIDGAADEYQDQQPVIHQTVIEISTAQDLWELSHTYGMNDMDYINIKYILTNDIDMTGVEGYIPIGHQDQYYMDINKRGFQSCFDGQGYTIRNLTIGYNGDIDDKNGYKSSGLFGVVAESAVIENLNIENIKIDGIGKNAYYNSTSGALAGWFSGTAKNCHVSGQISAIECSGGFVGRISGKTVIENCTADVDISGCWYTGGFMGYSDRGTPDVTIRNCASFGTVTAFIPSVYHEDINDVGGFIGYCTDGTIENCHAGSELVVIDTAVSIGGFVAHTHNATITDCTYDSAHTGSWPLIHWINFKKCNNGAYTPYTFAEKKNVTAADYKTAIAGVDKAYIQAVRNDGKYIIHTSDSTVAGDGGFIQYTLKEVATGRQKPLGFMELSRNLDTGFFSNGDAYMMNEYEGIRIYNTNMSDTQEIFHSGKYLPCGENIDGNGTERYLFAIRRDPVVMDYIVLYTEFVRSGKQPSDFNYIIGKLDAEGRLIFSQQLPAKVQWQEQLGFLTVNMYKSAENEIEFYTSYKDKQVTRGRYNFATGQYTQL